MRVTMDNPRNDRKRLFLLLEAAVQAITDLFDQLDPSYLEITTWYSGKLTEWKWNSSSQRWENVDPEDGAEAMTWTLVRELVSTPGETSAFK
jgi:hypothetical protein